MVELKVEKTADRSYLFLGTSNKITYSIIISNIGDTTARCVKIKDVMDDRVSYVKNSLSINGCKHSICAIGNYFSIGTIKAGANIIVSYDVEIGKCNPPNEIANQVTVSYCDNEKNFEVMSNKLIIPIINIDVTVCKAVDKDIAMVGEILSYTILIRNNSTVEINNAVLYDELMAELELIPSNVRINAEKISTQNLEEGISIGTIKSEANVIVTFQGIVREMPKRQNILNNAYITFEYSINDEGVVITSLGESCSNDANTKILVKNNNC